MPGNDTFSTKIYRATGRKMTINAVAIAKSRTNWDWLYRECGEDNMPETWRRYLMRRCMIIEQYPAATTHMTPGQIKTSTTDSQLLSSIGTQPAIARM